MVELRTLKESGRGAFGAWLDEGAIGGLPAELLTEEHSSPVFSSLFSIEQKNFENRYELGVYLNQVFSKTDKSVILNNEGLWNWITLFYFDQICPPDEEGQRNIKEIHRYILSTSFQKYYRHIVRASFDLVRIHGEYAKPMLFTPLYQLGDMLEQLSARQDIARNTGFMKVAYGLYFNTEKSKVKASASNRNKPGNVRRLITLFWQFYRTYDFYSMTPAQIVNLLPQKEFSGWNNLKQQAA